jgi:SMC interacting uncharacterized protein involved in chromosome segregation
MKIEDMLPAVWGIDEKRRSLALDHDVIEREVNALKEKQRAILDEMMQLSTTREAAVAAIVKMLEPPEAWGVRK